MKKTLLLAATALFALGVAAPAVHAEDYEAAVMEEHMDEAADAVEAAVVEHTLEDGTVVLVKGDSVFVVDADGNEVAAPDGEHVLEDGSVLVTEGGMLVHEAEDMMEEPVMEEHMDEGHGE